MLQPFDVTARPEQGPPGLAASLAAKASWGATSRGLFEEVGLGHDRAGLKEDRHVG